MADSTQNKDGTSTAKPAEQPIVDILEYFSGDVVIKAGADDRYGLIRVHKTCMIAASPVFAKMLNGGFSEATKTYTEAEPLVLDDDKYDAFLDMCKIIHYRTLEDEDSVTIERAVAIAVVADKYGCARQVLQAVIPVLCHLVYVTLRSHHLISHGQAKTLMYLAYLAKDKTLFWELSQQYVADLKLLPAVERVDNNLLSISPDITDVLERSRRGQLSLLEDRYNSILGDANLHVECNKHKDKLNAGIGEYTCELLQLKGRNTNCLPACSVSLSEMLNGLETIAPKLTGSRLWCDIHRTWEGVDFKQHVLSTVAQTRASLRGLCLGCDVVGGFGVEDGCRHFT